MAPSPLQLRLYILNALLAKREAIVGVAGGSGEVVVRWYEVVGRGLHFAELGTSRSGENCRKCWMILTDESSSTLSHPPCLD